jgi:hypothetical protein
MTPIHRRALVAAIAIVLAVTAGRTLAAPLPATPTTIAMADQVIAGAEHRP